MKREDYFEIVDSASEADITEMMQYHRSRHIPVRKEKIIMTQTESKAKKEGIITRNKGFAATAVAAALLALNIGGGYMLLHNRNQNALNIPAGSTDASEDGQPSEEITETEPESVPEVIAEESTEPEPAVAREDLPKYVQMMQRYYEDVSDTACYYDFTGLGKDIDETWENESYKVTLNAVTGCDWILYYFYDAEQKEGTSENGFLSDVNIEGKVMNGDYSDCSSAFGCLPSTEQEGDVRHCYGVIYNETGKPFFHEAGAQADKCLSFTVYSEGSSDLLQIPLDFVEQEYPLHACEQPGYISKFTEYGFLGILGIPEWMKEREVAPLNQCSETPFGIFYVSDPFETDGTWGGYSVYFLGSVESAFNEQMAEALSKVYEEGTKPGICSYTAYLQKNAAGETVKSLGFSHDVYCASFIHDEDREAVSCMYALFDQPVDLSEGTLVLADGE